MVVELIGDGTHLAHATIRSVVDVVGPSAIALVTHALAATGMPDGEYRLGPTAVRVRDGVARIVVDGREGSIAGSIGHLSGRGAPRGRGCAPCASAAPPPGR